MMRPLTERWERPANYYRSTPSEYTTDLHRLTRLVFTERAERKPRVTSRQPSSQVPFRVPEGKKPRNLSDFPAGQ